MKPLYYRFSYDPEGGADIAHDEGDPTKTRFLPDLAAGKVRGYAHRLANGWRITDLDMKAVDPHVGAAVERAIRSQEHDQKHSGWTFNQASLRYGSWPSTKKDE